MHRGLFAIAFFVAALFVAPSAAHADALPGPRPLREHPVPMPPLEALLAGAALLGSAVLALAPRYLPSTWDRPKPPPNETLDAELERLEGKLAEEETKQGGMRRYSRQHAATAYHERACFRFSRDDLQGALDDARRAVDHDPYVYYRATLAIIHGAMGDRAAMRREIEAALAGFVVPRNVGAELRDAGGRPIPPPHLARAYYVRAIALTHDGDLVAARTDLKRAQRLDPCDLYSTALSRLPRGPAGGER